MKKILIAIHDMKVGGAQKSLLSFLQSLVSSQHAEKYAIDLLVIRPEGGFFSQIPPEINILEPDKALRWMGASLNRDLLCRHFSLRGLWGELCWLIRKRFGLFTKGLNTQQKLWECWKNFIPERSDKYDVAVSYIDGTPNYYVMEKVRADQKILWIHNEYQKLGYLPDYDRVYFEGCDALITISSICQNCIQRAFPHLAQKVYVLENISVSKMLMQRSREGECPEYAAADGLKLLSVGRLNHQKGFDMAIEAARRLKENGLSFLWLVVGEGDERAALQAMIDEKGVADCFQLIGVRENPYAYMRACDILVQPSRWEGKSIVLDESKILCKPIVATSYTTVSDTITHGENGWIVEMSGEALAEGIMHLAQDEQLRSQLIASLQAAPVDNEKELQRYLQIML